MSARPLVSAIIIFLNEERFLQEALESVSAQSYDNWELLLVDDGSSDGSSAIAQRFAAEHPGKVRYLEHDGHQNRGMSASRNLGIRHARGTYISYLDGDDVWLPHKLERQVEILTAHPEAAMVYGPLQLWYSWTGDPEDAQRDELYGLHADGVSVIGDRLIQAPRLLSLFLQYPALIPSGIMIQRALLQSLGGAEDAFYGSYEDAVVLVKVCLTATVFVSSECWYKYRRHPDAWCKVERRLGRAEHNRWLFLQWVDSYLTQQGVIDPGVWRALHIAFWPYHHPTLYRLVRRSKRLTRFTQWLWFLPSDMLRGSRRLSPTPSAE
jgi:glycosyltransferase involved in cell wall biosynthesis